MQTQTFKHYANAAGRNEFIALEKTPKKPANTSVLDTISSTLKEKESQRNKLYFWEGVTVSSLLLLSL